jgi:hypothetical protein
MNPQQDNQVNMKDAYLRARKKTEDLKSFYMSLIIFCIVMPFLIYIWYKYSQDSIQWFWFPLIFWGLGIVFKGLKIYDKKVPFGKEWEQNKIEKYMREEENNTTL